MKLTDLFKPAYIYERRNKLVPKLKETIIELPHTLAAKGFPITGDDRKLAAFKNIHKGKIGFLIGNGPSVRVQDLEKLKNRVTFCCNRFYMAYETMEFRPTYTLASDLQTLEDFGEEIVNKSEGTVFIAWKTRPQVSGDFIWIRSQQDYKFVFAENIFGYVMPGGGTLITAIQLGYFMGDQSLYPIWS